MEQYIYEKRYQLKNGKSVIIRQPQEEDAQSIIDVIKQADTESRFLAREPDEFSVSLEKECEMVSNKLEDSDSRWYIAEYDGRVVGQCAVGLAGKNLRFRHRANVAFVVLKDYWNLGIGGKMMEECINWCKDHNVEQIELDVNTDNIKAKAMYESFGFEVNGKTPNSLKYSDDTYADEYSMMLRLNT